MFYLSSPSESKIKEMSKLNGKITLNPAWDLKNPFSILMLPLKIFKLNPDVVHFNVHLAFFGNSRLINFVGLCIPFFCRILGLKTVVTLHNIAERVNLKKVGFRDAFLNRLGTLIATKILTYSSKIVVTMKSYSELLKERYNSKNSVWIPHGTWNVDVELKTSQKS